MLRLGFAPLEVMLTLPLAAPLAVGAKVTVNDVLWPALNVKGKVSPAQTESGATRTRGRDRKARSAGIGQRLRQVRTIADLNVPKRQAGGVRSQCSLRHAGPG